MHKNLATPGLIKCQKCGKPVRSHQVCPNCGYYREQEVVDVLSKLTKKERKTKERELKAQEDTAQGELSAEQLSKKS